MRKTHVLGKVIAGCFGGVLLVSIAWWSGSARVPDTQVSVGGAYATVDDVYAALSRQMGGATPDFETQVKPTLDLHMTYAELQAFVDEGRHAPTPSPERIPAPPTTTQPAPVVAPPATPPVTVMSVAWGPCTKSAKAGGSGWIDCPGTVTLKINRPVPSGSVSVSFDYPDAGSFFHGQAQVGGTTGATLVVPVMNTYVSHCVTPFATTVVVRDGAYAGPILVSQPITLTATGTCG